MGCVSARSGDVDRYEDEGLDALVDKRLSQVSARRAPVDEVVRTEALYRERYDGWNVKHFYSFYRRRHAGTRSYSAYRNPNCVSMWCQIWVSVTSKEPHHGMADLAEYRRARADRDDRVDRQEAI